MAKDPCMPLYARDWLAATRLLSPIARAAYIDLLAYQWLEGPLPNDTERLRRICSYDREEFALAWAEIAPEFDETPEGLVNDRLKAIYDEREQHRRKQAENGKKGGRPRKGENPDETQTESESKANQKPKENPNESQIETQTKANGKPKPEPKQKPASASASASAIADTDASASGADTPPDPGSMEPKITPEAVTFEDIYGVLCDAAERLDLPEPIHEDARGRLIAKSSPIRKLIAKLGREATADLYVWVTRNVRNGMDWGGIWNQHMQFLAKMKSPVPAYPNGKNEQPTPRRPYITFDDMEEAS